MSSPREDELASLKDSAKGVLDETHQQAGELQHRYANPGEACGTLCPIMLSSFDDPSAWKAMNSVCFTCRSVL